MATLTYLQVLNLTIEQLALHPVGQYEQLLGFVIEAARKSGLVSSGSLDPFGGASVNNPGYAIPHDQAKKMSELVRQAMWDCLLQRKIVFGMDPANPTWPFYRT